MTGTMVDYRVEYHLSIKPDYKAFDEYLPEYWEMTYGDRWQKIQELLEESISEIESY